MLKVKTNTLVIIVSVAFAAIAFFNIFRPDPKTEVYAGSTERGYTEGNHEVFVYTGYTPQPLRTSPDFLQDSNIAGQLEAGSVFFLSDESKGIQTRTIKNYPLDNVSEYIFQRVNVFQYGDMASYYVMNKYIQSLLDTDGNEAYKLLNESNGLHNKYMNFIDYIATDLRASGCSLEKPCSNGNFGFIGEGLYYSTVTEKTPVYSRKGKLITYFETGTKVLFSYNLPPVTGKEDPTRIRSVGYIRQGQSKATIGTFFFEMFPNKLQAIATTNK